MLGPLGTAGLVIVFVVFMLLEREDLRGRVIGLVGHGHLAVTTKAFDEAGSRVSRQLLMQTLVNAAYGVAIGAGTNSNMVVRVTRPLSAPRFASSPTWDRLPRRPAPS